MTDGLWRAAYRLLEQACERPEPERVVWIQSQAPDPQVRDLVLSMLREMDQPGEVEARREEEVEDFEEPRPGSMAGRFQVDTRELVVLDFETTGLLPARDRTIAVALTLLVDHRPVDTFCRLMHPGFALPSFITSLTGITDQMLRGQPRPEDVMPALHRFVRGLPIVAHNASFDRAFLHAELARAGLQPESEFLCTMRLARRLAPGLLSYRLDTLVDALQVRPRARGNSTARWPT